MPVQDVYKFTKQGDDRRIVAGTIDSGTVRVGDEVVFYPSGKQSRVKSIEAFNRRPAAGGGGLGCGLHADRADLRRAGRAGDGRDRAPAQGHHAAPGQPLLARQAALDQEQGLPPQAGHGAGAGSRRGDPPGDGRLHPDSDNKDRVDRHEVAECILKLNRAIAFDLADEIAATSRFVIVDDFEIRGGGIVREALPDRQAEIRDQVLLRNYKWEPSIIQPERRAEKYSQKAPLLLITGAKESDRKGLARMSKPGCSRTDRWSTSSASATCSTAWMPTSSASPRTGRSTCAGWLRSPTSCSMPA